MAKHSWVFQRAWATGRIQECVKVMEMRKSHVHFRLAAVLNKFQFQLNYIEINW